MMFGLERGDLFAAHVSTATRHHHRRIPAQQRQRAAKRVQAAKLLLQLLVRRHGHDLISTGIGQVYLTAHPNGRRFQHKYL